MRAEAIDHLNLRIPAARVDDVATFYRDRLGFDLEFLEEYRAGEQGFFYVRLAPDCVFHVTPVDEFEPPDGRNFDHVAVRVDVTEAELRRRLDERDVEVRDEAAHLGAVDRSLSLYVEDPAGYTVELNPVGDA